MARPRKQQGDGAPRVFRKTQRDDAAALVLVRREAKRRKLKPADLSQLTGGALDEKQARAVISGEPSPRWTTHAIRALTLEDKVPTKSNRRYYVEVHDQYDVSRRFPATTDRKTSAEYGRLVQRLVSLRRVNKSPESDGEVLGWLKNLPADDIGRFVRFGILPDEWSPDGANGKSMDELIELYREHLRAKGRSPGYVKDVSRRVKLVIEMMKVRAWHQVSVQKARDALNKLREELGWNEITRNHALTAIVTFGNYLEAERGIGPNPISAKKVGALPENPKRRRALLPEEQRRLIAAAEHGETIISRTNRGRWHKKLKGEDDPKRIVWQLSGPERALLYRLAIETGFRRSSIIRLRVKDFNLSSDPPTVTLRGMAATKTKQDNTNVLTPELAAKLRAYFKETRKLPDAQWLSSPREYEFADLVRMDMAEARRQWIAEAPTAKERAKRADDPDFLQPEDSKGRRVDFHALRGTAATNLVLANVAPAVTMAVLGHRNIATTMKHYTSVEVEHKKAAMRAVFGQGAGEDTQTG